MRGSAALVSAALVVPLALAAGIVVAPPAAAVTTTYTVNFATDSTSGSCAAGSVTCNLRAAIAAANTNASATPLNPTLINVPGGFTAGLTAGVLPLGRPMTIQGVAQQPGAAATTIDGKGLSRVFNVTSVGVTIDGVVIKGGFVGNNANGAGVNVATTGALTLSRSTITGNSAGQGAGVEVDGTATISQTTITANTASGKGGGIYDAGTLTVLDSTVHANTAKGGGGIASAGTTTLKAVTVTGNASNNSNGGGLYRTGGTFTVSGSILAANNASTGRDCYGSPSFVGTNIVQYTSGCNPSGGTILVTDPLLGALANNGGATQSRMPQTGSPAIDAYSSSCVTATDQRGVTRPGGAKCDVGSVEYATLGMSVSLSTDKATVKAGTGPIDAQNVPAASVLPTPASIHDAVIRNAVIRNAVIRNADTSFAVIRNAVIRNAVIRNAVIRNAVIRNAVIRNAVIRNADAEATLVAANLADPLKAVHLSDVPLVRPGGWPTFLQNATIPSTGASAATVPLENLALGSDVNVGGSTKTIMRLVEDAGITVDELDLSQVLGYEPVAALLLSAVPMRSIPLSVALESGTDQNRLDAWCAALKFTSGAPQDPCASLGGAVPGRPAYDATPLAVAMAGFSMDGATINGVFQGISLNDILVKDVAASMRTTDPANPGWLQLLMLRGYATSTAVGSIPVSDIPCTLFINDTCPSPTTQTLRNVAAQIDPQSALDDLFLAPTAGHQALADLVNAFTLGDLVQGLLPGDALPWDNIDISSTPLQPYIASPGAEVLTYRLDLTISGTAGATTATLDLPAGFLPTTRDQSGNSVFTVDGSPKSGSLDANNRLTLPIGTLNIGAHVISIAAWAGTALGDATATANANATSGALSASGTSQATVNVVESYETAGTTACTSTGSLPADYLACDSVNANNGVVYEGHISTPTDRDVYTFTVPASNTTRTRASINLSNIPAGHDFDLALFGPTTANIRNTPLSSQTGVADSSYEIYGAGSTLAPDTQSDVPSTPPAALGMGTIGGSFQRGSTAEQIDTGRLAPGNYAIQVSGYNADTSTEPYTVRLRTTTENLAPCSAAPSRTNGAPTTPLTDVSSPVNGAGTTPNPHVLFLVPQYRFAGTYGTAAADSVISKVQTLAAQVGGTIIAIDNSGTSQNLYSAWDANRCSADAANAVVRDIGQQMDAVRNANPANNYDSVVVVGDDNIIPMARVIDRTQIANESSYGASLQGVSGGSGRTDNELSRSLADGYYLTDNAYGTSAGVGVDTHELFVPDMAVGRLVETPADIVAAIDQYLNNNGQLDSSTATSALVTGYDFMADGATAVAAALQANGLSVDSQLVGSGWTATQLKAALLGPGAAPGVVSFNGHFDQTRLLAGDSKSIVSTTDFQAALGKYARRLLFSMGCHSGLSVSDISIGAQLDWPQELTGTDQGGTYAGNTGFGYGDDQTVTLSERLVGLYAKALDGSKTVGEALAEAKRQYLATTLLLTPYDEKVIQEMNFYGLPFYALYGSTPSAPSGPSGASALSAPSGPTSSPISLDFAVGGSSSPNTLHLVPTPNGSYYEVNGETLNVQYRPIEPLATVDVTQAGSQAHGILLTQLTSTDQTGFTPNYFRPTVDDGASENLLSGVGDAVFPATIATVGHAGTGANAQDFLVVAPGQAQDPVNGTVTQRLFTHVGGLVQRSNSADRTPSSILQSRGEIVNNTAGFVVDTGTDATRVYVLYKPQGSSVWKGIDLTQGGVGIGGSSRWWGGGSVPQGVTKAAFLVQVVDAAGNVGLSTNKVSDFDANKVAQVGSLHISVTPTAPASGWYTQGPITVTIANQNAATIIYSVDGSTPTAYSGALDLFALGSGVHHLVATDSSGGLDAVDVSIDTAKPSIVGAIDPGALVSRTNVTTGQTWFGGAVNLVLTANDDPKGSGIAAIMHSHDGGATRTTVTNLSVSPSGAASVTIPVASSATYDPYTANDVAGNQSDNGGPTPINIDTKPPVITCTPPSASAYYNTDVSVPCTATDAGVGFAAAGGVPFSLSTDLAANPGATSATTNSRQVCDLLNNCATSPSYTFNIDTTGPSIAINAPTNGSWFRVNQVVSASYSCADSGGSGIASCIGTVANGSAIDTTGASTTFTVAATDNAGNVSTKTTTYNIDGVAPTITITSPTATSYNYTSSPPAASYSCADGESGLASCVGPVASGQPIDISPGAHTFTVNAADNAGNTATKQVSYVAGYRVCLLYDSVTPQSRTGTVVIKLQLCNPAGTNLSSANIKLTATCLAPGTNPIPPTPCPNLPSLNFQGNSNSGYQFRYSSGQYIYNLDPTKTTPPLGGGAFTMYFQVDATPGLFYMAPFALK